MTILETERLRLRPMNMADVDDLLLIFSDLETMRYYPGTKDRAAAEGWISWNLGSYEKHGFGLWIASLKKTDEFAGQCGLVYQEVEGRPETEIGYLFLRRLWGQGLATEAAQACRDYGLSVLGRHRLVSLINPNNMPSRRVAEKVGMTLEKEIFKWERPVCVYALDTGKDIS